MPQASSQPPGVFICYRRDDSAGHALHLFYYLREHVRGERVFLDTGIEAGDEFAQKIERELASCEIFIALIGKRWLTMQGDAGRRLDDPGDFVRMEIAAALGRGITVVPVLVDGAHMPLGKDLPEDISGLLAHQGIELSNQRWEYDAGRLVRRIRQVLAEQREAARIKKAASVVPTTMLTKGGRRVRRAALSASLALAGALLWAYAMRSAVNRPENGAGAVIGQGSGRLTDQAFINAFGVEFVWVPRGVFRMGSEHGFPDERPVHQVAIVSGFYMGKYEVTQAQWLTVMGKGNNPSSLKGENLPVEKVSRADAQRFVDRLNEKEDGYAYRLPTEAEWEYAARAGADGDYAGYMDSTAWCGGGPHEGNRVASARLVGQKGANAFGLHDMQGNVQEWVQDSYHDSYDGAPLNGSAWMDGGEQGYGVVRGGSSYSLASFCRLATRVQVELSSRADLIGFRVVASVKR